MQTTKVLLSSNQDGDKQISSDDGPDSEREGTKKLHRRAMSAAIFFWTRNTIFALSIDLILCALSQRYNPFLQFFPFSGSDGERSNVEEEGADYEGRKEGNEGSYTEITRPIRHSTGVCPD